MWILEAYGRTFRKAVGFMGLFAFVVFGLGFIMNFFPPHDEHFLGIAIYSPIFCAVGFLAMVWGLKNLPGQKMYSPEATDHDFEKAMAEVEEYRKGKGGR